MENNDPRYVRSRRKLRAAFLEIAHDDPAKLSVSAVCEQTGLDRATFYRHFDALDDLVADALGEYADRSTAQWDATSTGSGTQFDESSAIFTAYLRHIEENWPVYRWALGPQGSTKTAHVLLSRFARGPASELTRLAPELSDEERDFRAAFIAGGILGACVHWLSTDVPSCSAEVLTVWILRSAEQNLEQQPW
ncbi:TetR/AcrR family transcriptional regulator [Streptomyces collinus]|uniref:TetR/AcrR family transcriptional regulator n=1 Tax=Streptomyces collinus TaxID=42684 RepID=UPI0036785158